MTRAKSPDSNPTRQAIHEHVHARPGVHFNALVRDLDFAPGQVQYHVHRLLDGEHLIQTRLYGRTHYFPTEFDEWERDVLALFRRETTRGILLYLLEHDPAAPATVADELDVTRSTLEWHLEHLQEQEIIEKRYDDRNHVELTLTHPDRTASFLRDVAPTITDRLTDRFVRFVDHLFEDGAAGRTAGEDLR